MREIKFRAWYGRAVNKMLYDEKPGDCLVWKNQGQNIEAIMQFTGLLDRQGKEIYEGDLLRKPDGRIVKVFWFQSSIYCGWDITPINSVGKPPYSQEIWTSGWEVIGNVWENPDLVTQ